MESGLSQNIWDIGFPSYVSWSVRETAGVTAAPAGAHLLLAQRSHRLSVPVPLLVAVPGPARHCKRARAEDERLKAFTEAIQWVQRGPSSELL